MIRIGVAGWDYADWRGVVYPAGAGARFDRLAYLAEFVDVVEINSSFYRPVRPRVAESWVRRTEHRAGFRFTAKAHRGFTHEPGEEPATDVARTLEGLRPLLEAGRLGALLLQFPQSTRYRPAVLAHLERLLDRCVGWPVVVEVRHASWGAEEVVEWLTRRAVGWCAVDQPDAGRATLGRLPRVTAPVAYLRMHGRNVADWFRPDAGRDARYDYLYAPEELEQIAGSAETMARTAESLFVVQNNHFRGQALVNALQLKRRLQRVTPTAPGSLLAAYPELEGTASPRERGLF